jgi:hypothetical protein
MCHAHHAREQGNPDASEAQDALPAGIGVAAVPVAGGGTMNYKQGLSCVGALALGMGAGYVVGLLTAPAAGDETRRRLAWRLNDEKNRLRRTGQRVVDDTATRLEHGIESGKHKIDQILQG